MVCTNALAEMSDWRKACNNKLRQPKSERATWHSTKSAPAKVGDNGAAFNNLSRRSKGMYHSKEAAFNNQLLRRKRRLGGEYASQRRLQIDGGTVMNQRRHGEGIHRPKKNTEQASAQQGRPPAKKRRRITGAAGEPASRKAIWRWHGV